MKKLAVTIVFILLAAVFYLLHFRQVNKNLVKATIGGQNFILEVADTENLRSKGLSGRSFLTKNKGMLFVFPNKNLYSFWMKDMNFPLDFIWIENDKIVDLTENVPPPDKNHPDDLPLITPISPVNKVIEVNSGIIAELKLKKDDKIIFE